MVINTRHFGEIDIAEEQVLDFKEGIIGYEASHRFAVINSEDPESPFKWIQSIDNTELAFALIDPFTVRKDYDFELKEEYVSLLEIEAPSQVAVYAIVVVPEDIKRISMNLKAPLVINRDKSLAAQVILDTDKYSVRHYILDELQKSEV